MGGSTDQIKGRIKEAAGTLTDNDRLKREGELDQAVGTAEKAVDKMKEALTNNTPRDRTAIQETPPLLLGTRHER